jgi:hypothetical protein
VIDGAVKDELNAIVVVDGAVGGAVDSVPTRISASQFIAYEGGTV